MSGNYDFNKFKNFIKKSLYSSFLGRTATVVGQRSYVFNHGNFNARL